MQLIVQHVLRELSTNFVKRVISGSLCSFALCFCSSTSANRKTLLNVYFNSFRAQVHISSTDFEQLEIGKMVSTRRLSFSVQSLDVSVFYLM